MVKRHNHLMIIVEAEISIIRWNILRQFIMIVPNDDVHWPPRQSQRPPSNPPSLEYLTSGNDCQCQFCKFLQHICIYVTSVQRYLSIESWIYIQCWLLTLLTVNWTRWMCWLSMGACWPRRKVEMEIGDMFAEVKAQLETAGYTILTLTMARKWE